MKNKKPIVALGALAVVGLIAGTIAYFTSEATFDNVFTTAVYKTQSTETFTSPDNWTPGQEIPKTVITENQGTIPVSVRVTKSETWVDENNETITSNTLSSIEQSIPGDVKKIAIINLQNTSDWIVGSDGAYYFKRALAAADNTDPSNPEYDRTNSFIESVTLNPALPTDSSCETTTNATTHTTTKTCSTVIAGLGKATYTLTLTVETVQYDQYKAVWFASDAANNYANAVVIAPAA